MARRLIGVGVLGLALLVPASAHAAIKVKGEGQRYVPGEAIVRFESGVVAAERRATRADAGVSFEESLRIPRTQVVSFDGSVTAAIARLEREPGVAYAQPNYRYRALAEPPNDTHFGLQWGLMPTPGVGALAAWDRTRGAGQVIAVLDTGVDLSHPDLAGHLWVGAGGVNGHDFVDGDTNPDDFQYHGTHVAGISAAIANNGQGVAGVAPEAQIMAVRVLDGDGSGSTSDIANGIDFASGNGAGAINMSLGGPAGPGDPAMSDAATRAEQRGSTIVAAAGNESNNNDAAPSSPCNLPNANIVCIAAVGDDGNLASYSNFGSATVDVAAPGGDADPGEHEILSTKPSWGAPEFFEGFEAGTGLWTPTSNTAVNWAQTGVGAGSSNSATDSPSANYANNTDSSLVKSSALNLSGKRGCRVHFDARVSINDIDDFMAVGVSTLAGNTGQTFFGETFGAFVPIELSVSGVDGRSDVKPALAFHSDVFQTDDGGYVDNYRLLCRASDYDNDIVPADQFELPAAGGGGSYMAISGTSMAAPHAAGVAALVRAADPGAPPSQIVQAIRNGSKPSGNLAAFTITGGIVDAAGAIDAALALPNPPPPAPPPPLQPQLPVRPNAPRISNVRFNARRGVLRMLVRADADTTGVVTLRANITAARVRVVGRKAFAIGRTGRTTVRIKLRKPALRQLRRKRRLRLTARVAVRNSAGLRASTTRTIRLRLRRR